MTEGAQDKKATQSQARHAGGYPGAPKLDIWLNFKMLSSPTPKRSQSIDTFRGIAIVGMVFYSLLYRSSHNLPYLLNHNSKGILLIPGDFVLALFLFASGASIVFFTHKRLEKGWLSLSISSLKKIAKLAFVWIFLSILTLNLDFGMDEIALNMVLFVPCIALSLWSTRIGVCLYIGLLAAHYLLQSQGMLPDYSIYYLGGFEGAILYLPVCLGGVLVVKSEDYAKQLLLGSAVLTILLLSLQEADKLSLTASFSALSVTFSLALFMLCKNFSWEPLTYLGKKPLRYWVMMYLFFIIPIKLYCRMHELRPPRLSLDWSESLLFSTLALVTLYGISKAFDRFVAWKP